MISFQKIFSMKALRLPSGWPACSHAVRTSIGSSTFAIAPAFFLFLSFSRCFASSEVNFFVALRSTPLFLYLPPAPGRELVLSGCNRTNQISR